MHIKKIFIKNFRNFSKFEIKFSEGFQTIIGENNVGKSNLYYAIRLVLDNNLSYKDRLLDEQNFHGFGKLKIGDHIIISIEFFSDNLSSFPNLHAIKTSDNTARVTYVYAHQSVLRETEEKFEKVEIKDFRYNIYGGGDTYELSKLIELNRITFKELEGINLFYITAFRNIYRDIHGSTSSLLSQFCSSRENAEEELSKINSILEFSSNELNKLDFIPDVSSKIKTKSNEIAGNYFSFPISLSFLSNYQSDSWNKLNIFFNPEEGKNIPINILGLGQQNILYLSLFVAKLINEQNKNELNILLIEEPEAHLHPQLQKLLFSNLGVLNNTQVFMTSHSTHIASDCEFKNLNILYKNIEKSVKSFSPFLNNLLSPRETLLLKRYLDATRSEIFFASAVIFVEGVAEQFLLPAIAKAKYGLSLIEYNISIIPIHSRYFDPFLKICQNNNLEIIACAIIDGDSAELKRDDDSTTAVQNAKKLEIENRVKVFVGNQTFEIDLFPAKEINSTYLNKCFENLGHQKSHANLMESNTEDWANQLISKIDQTVKKGRFAQELSTLLDKDFNVPKYIDEAIKFITRLKGIPINVK
jgi:putative ATP-dependent endonuclease of the OLD family